MFFALFSKGPWMVPAIARGGISVAAEYFAAEYRAGEFGRPAHSCHRHRGQYFLFHLLGDVPSPTLMGLSPTAIRCKAAFILPVIAMAVSSAILFYGMRFAPAIRARTSGAAGVLAE